MSAPISGEIDLSGQTAIVTGAAGGIGRATCESLAREGADVVAADIDGNALAAAKAAVGDRNSRCETVPCDVTDTDDVERLREVASEAFDTIDILVTAHGIVSRKSLPEMDLDDWGAVIDVNLTGTMLVVRTLYEHMTANEYGKIVCLGSIAGKVGGVISGPNYVASKGGIHAFVKWVATDTGSHNVYVNAIAPGPVKTPMTEDENYSSGVTVFLQFGEPADIGERVLFLASQQSNWLTGTVLDVNVGLRMD